MPPKPYQIAVLCYLYDEDNRLLLLHRAKSPNMGQYSPVGGKLEMDDGEGVHECAVREIEEETGIALDLEEVRMIGLVSERAYEGKGHWMIFLFEATRPIRHDELAWTEFDEGTLEWIHVDDVAELDIPDTDRIAMTRCSYDVSSSSRSRSIVVRSSPGRIIAAFENHIAVKRAFGAVSYCSKTMSSNSRR